MIAVGTRDTARRVTVVPTTIDVTRYPAVPAGCEQLVALFADHHHGYSK